MAAEPFSSSTVLALFDLGEPAVGFCAALDVFPTIDFGFPLSVVPAQLQRVVDTMVEFGMLPAKDISFKITKMTG